MPTKPKEGDSMAISVRNPRLVHYICAECGLEVEAPRDSKCKHCGCVMDKVKGRMKK